MGKPELQPFSKFGSALRKLREKQRESAIEVSGAVEIDEKKLKDYEMGKSRPSIDILMLLIQHFDIQDEEAQELWRLAGYQDGMLMDEAQFFMNDEEGGTQQMAQNLVSQNGEKIVYTDMIQVMVNNYGVTLHFLQGSAQGQPLAVARVGMSKEHARSVLQVLQKTLEQSDTIATRGPGQLPSGPRKQD